MIGAAITIGLLAVLMSTMATVTNIVIRREFPSELRKLEFDQAQDQPLRLGCYQVAANIFFYESLILWAAFVAILGLRILGGFA